MLDTVPVMPLHAVLFPSMPLQVHVFEDRYRQMVRHCLEERMPFGVVLIREGDETGPPAVPEDTGTLARIYAVKRLAGGAMNVYAVGTERFRVTDYDPGAPSYPRCAPSPVNDAPAEQSDLTHLVQEIGDLFEVYFRALTLQAKVEQPVYVLPPDPVELSFLMAAVLQADLPVRQEMLELTDTAARLQMERDLLRSEESRLRASARPARLAAHKLTTALLSAQLSRN